MAKYVILIYGDPQQWASMTPEKTQAHHAAHGDFAAAAGSKILSGHELQETATATTLRADSGAGFITTDGPFLETKEVLGGYYLLEAADLDAAIALAGLLPEVATSHSGVEIRPIRENN